MEQGERNSQEPNPNPCPICLGFITHESFLDHCFHKFCYDCILRWTKIVSSKSSSSQQPSSIKCPLCKTENFSIIYGYDGNTFQQHFIKQNTGNSTFFSKAHKYRLQCYYTEPGLLEEAFKLMHYWKMRKYLLPNKHLEVWTRRELQALLQEEDVEIIMHHILGVIESFSRSHHLKCPVQDPQQKQEEFRVLVSAAARPFITARTERFVNEIELFLASGLTVEAYDNAYKRCLGWKKPTDDIPQDAQPTVTEHGFVAPCLLLFDDDSDQVEWSDSKTDNVSSCEPSI
ncbi:uncharacterized protein LOC141647851 isoform X1 [Silene latifolia]|uniref:uncharacterized protein LOC141647851 isoform X1 n=1 Tax=Silene latifolia TaxID=37657 RepID=UPI003D775C73